MSSLLTNNSAMTALTTLKSINRDLEATGSRISTGMKVATAADNAAYWSIATTVRSDNLSLGAVKDVLGLGSSTVDTTYNGLNSTIEDMKGLRAKLTAAMAPNVDRGKVQVEIAAMQSKMKATAESSVMSGQNWLSVDSSTTNASYQATQKIVAGFSRDATGAIAFSTVDVNVGGLKLYDQNAASVTTPATAGKVTANSALIGTIDFSGTNEVNFSLDVDNAGAETITLNSASLASAVADLSAVTADELITAINNQIAANTNLAGTVTAGYDDDGRMTFTSATPGAASEIEYTVLAATGGNALVDVGFGTTATDTYTGTGTAAATTAARGILDTVDGGTTFSISNIDISGLTGAAGDTALKNIITQVDKALGKMTDAATAIGANKTQLSGQMAFVDTLMKSNDRTIGTLVDADMEEESSRLKALQVQQQLGVQSLSIANSNSQGILSLFR